MDPAQKALREITSRCVASSLMEEDCLAALQTLNDDPVVSFIIEACLKHQVTTDEILSEVQQYELG